MRDSHEYFTHRETSVGWVRTRPWFYSLFVWLPMTWNSFDFLLDNQADNIVIKLNLHFPFLPQTTRSVEGIKTIPWHLKRWCLKQLLSQTVIYRIRCRIFPPVHWIFTLQFPPGTVWGKWWACGSSHCNNGNNCKLAPTIKFAILTFHQGDDEESRRAHHNTGSDHPDKYLKLWKNRCKKW